MTGAGASYEGMPMAEAKLETSAPTRIGQLLTVEDVARLTRVSSHAIHMQRYRGQDPGSLGFLVGARVLFWPEEVHQWLRQVQAAQRSS